MTLTLPEGWQVDPAVAERTVKVLRAAYDAQHPPRVFKTPGELARTLNKETKQTPALDVIDEAIVWAYTTPGARLIVSMPPQEGKSQRVTRTGVLWALLRNPELRIGIVSYAKNLAESFGRDIRNWIASHNGTDGTLDLRLRIASDNGAAARWQLDDHQGGVYCVGIGGGLTGRPIDALVIDDPFADAEQADSPAYRQKVWEWWQAVGATRLAPGAPVIVINTRWHEDDLVGRLLAAEDGNIWRVINIPALADHDPDKGQTDTLGREPGQWMVSARGRTEAEWEAIKIRSGSRVFSALYQGNPTPDVGNVWQRHWWRRYDTPLWTVNPDGVTYTVPEADEVIMSWDMAFKDTKSSDYVVGQVWARRGANAYLLDQVRNRLSFTETVDALQTLITKWPDARARLVEDKANGTAVISLLKGKVPGLIPVNPTDSKYGRAVAVAPFIEAGNVHLPSPRIALFDTGVFVDETAAFPNDTHDDQVDAASQALARLFLDPAGAAAWAAYVASLAEAQKRAPEPEPDPDPLTAARNQQFRAGRR